MADVVVLGGRNCVCSHANCSWVKGASAGSVSASDWEVPGVSRSAIGNDVGQHFAVKSGDI